METTGIIIAIILFAVGLLIGWIVWGRNSSSDDHIDAETSGNKSEELESTIAEKDKALNQATAEIKTLRLKVEDLKGQFSTFQAEKEKQIHDLETQLPKASNDNVDEVVKKKLEDLVKLQKKVASLEDDVADLEDDVDNYKKKLNNKNTELANTQDDLNKVNKEVRQLQEDLSIKSKDLDIKIESLNFVQEILLAKADDSDDDRKLSENVGKLKDFIRDEFIDALEDFIEIDKSKMSEDPIFGNKLDRWAATAKKSWLNGKTTIAFVGEFSAGKTSIVNRILSQDDENVPKLPVSTKATTAIPTYISGASVPSYRFVTQNDEIKALSVSTFKKVNKEMLDQVKGMSSLIKYFVMRYKNPNLEHLSILDTPGFSSNDKEDADRTIDVINECDALFWVFDVNNGNVNRASIELIKKNLHRPLYIVINKVDTKSKVEVDKEQSVISETLADEGIQVVEFIRFSEKAPLDTIMKPILSIQHDNSKDNYLADIQEKTQQVCDHLEEETKKSERKAYKLQLESQILANKFKNSLNDLQEDCDTAAKIPRYEKYKLRKNRFEMNTEENELFNSILEKIRTQHPEKLTSLYNDQISKITDMVKAWKDAREAKSNLITLQNSIKMLKNKIKAVDPNSVLK